MSKYEETFLTKFYDLIDQFSVDGEADSESYILAKYMVRCLLDYKADTKQPEDWFMPNKRWFMPKEQCHEEMRLAQEKARRAHPKY